MLVANTITGAGVDLPPRHARGRTAVPRHARHGSSTITGSRSSPSRPARSPLSIGRSTTTSSTSSAVLGKLVLGHGSADSPALASAKPSRADVRLARRPTSAATCRPRRAGADAARPLSATARRSQARRPAAATSPARGSPARAGPALASGRCAGSTAATRRSAASRSWCVGIALAAHLSCEACARERARPSAARRQLPAVRRLRPPASKRLRRWRTRGATRSSREPSEPLSTDARSAAGGGPRTRRSRSRPAGRRRRPSASPRTGSTRFKERAVHPFARQEYCELAGAAGRLVRRPPGRVLRHRRAERLGQEHAAEDPREHLPGRRRDGSGWPAGWRRSSSSGSASTRS